MSRAFQEKRSFAAAGTFGALICVGGMGIAVFAQSGSEKSKVSQEAVRTPQGGVVAESPGEGRNKNGGLTAGQIRDALIHAAAKLVDLKIVVVEKGDFVLRSENLPVPVVFKEVWLHGQSAQVRMDWRANGNGEKWWTGFKPIKGPLTSAHLDSIPGLKACVDMSRDLVYADSRLFRPGPDGKSRTLHSVSKSPQMAPFLFLPLVEFNKPWIPSNRLGGSPVVNAIAGRPLSAWRLLGDTKLGEEEAILAEISQNGTVAIPLKRHAGELSLTQGYLVWFAKRYGGMPLRVEQTMRYGFKGREYRLERRPDGKAFLVYEASDFTQIGDVWVPRVGRQSTYQPTDQHKKQVQNGFDFDALVDKLLADGTMRYPDELRLGYRYEWRILSIEPIDPSLKLWFEPQAGAEVVNMETHKRYVQGDRVASKRFADRERAIEARVGHPAPEFPEGATWLNGEPLSWKALRGKVVILDFWADSCGACRNDLPRLCQLHDDRRKNGLAIIGVHVCGSELKSVKKAISDFHLEYPICIDMPNHPETDKVEEMADRCKFTSQFAINAIPHFVVVDRRGIVAASLGNGFQDALAIAQRLAKAKD